MQKDYHWLDYPRIHRNTNDFCLTEWLSSTSQMIGLYGARGAGKTTLLLQVVKELKYKPSEALYISCEHPAFQDFHFLNL
jgi:predicted AAA+ superfamily ATPase